MIAGIAGHGPDIALIHGWGLDSAVWAPVADILAENCRVHRIDLPGYGMTPADGRDFAQTAQSLVDALPAGVTLCGWSLGGMLALRAALLAPSRIARLVVVGGTPSFAQRDGWAPAQPPALLDAFTTALAQDAAGTLQRFVALFNQGDRHARHIGRAVLKGNAAPPPAATLQAGLRWLRDTDLRALAGSIALPALVIHGAHDPLMPLAAGQWLAERLPDAQLEVFAEAAHAPFHSDPQRFAARVGAFCHASAIRHAPLAR